jgi:chromosome segregation ATPase
MGDTTEIEKKSLEAHVELCAERYRFLEDKLETVEEKITGLSAVIREVHDMIHAMAEKRNNQVLAWGTGLVASLFAIIGYLLIAHVFK